MERPEKALDGREKSLLFSRLWKFRMKKKMGKDSRKRTLRLMRLENTPEGRVVSLLLSSEYERGEERGDDNKKERELREER